MTEMSFSPRFSRKSEYCQYKVLKSHLS